MYVLALDASTPTVTVALARVNPREDRGDFPEREVLAEISVSGGVRGASRGASGASEVLLAAVDSAFSFTGISLKAVERVLVGVGPGTFTGIRIAAATARALASGTGIKLSKGSTLDALAAPALSTVSGDRSGERPGDRPGERPGDRGVLAVLDARRREVFVRRYAPGGTAGEVYCGSPEGLSGLTAGDLELLVVGDGAVRYRQALEELGYVPPDGSPLHRVTAAGHVMSADLSAVAVGDLVPLYVREPDAEVRRETNPWSQRS